MKTVAETITNWLSATSAIVAVIVAAIGLYYAGRQLGATRRTTKGQFLLSIEDQLQHHAAVHVKLMPGGVWTEPDTGPTTPDEWAAVVAYLGLFERMNALRHDGTLSLRDIQSFYSYRLHNAWANDRIRSKVEQNSGGWRKLIDLHDALEAAEAKLSRAKPS